MTDQGRTEAITADGLRELRAELERLETDGRREIARRIQAARELGDLKENAEYHIAKEDQAHLETKIKRLVERLRNAVVVDAPADADIVSFGTTVTVAAEPRAGRISSESPIAQALIGRSRGDTVQVQTPRGERAWRIDRIGE